MPTTIWDILKQVNEKTTKYKYDKKIVSGFHLMNWLSHDQFLMSYVQEINKIMFTSGIKDDMVYKYFFHTIPKRRRYIKYIKKDPEDTNRTTVLEKIAEEQNVSIREASNIFDTIEKINHKRIRSNNDDIPF